MIQGPLYLLIASELRQNIQDDVYKVGQQIPTEENLACHFSVNRHTLRRAVGVLVSEGLLRVDQGRGTFVAAAPIRYPIGSRVRFNESLKAQGLTPSYELLRASEVPASGAVARTLEASPGAGVAVIERLGLADGCPLKVSTSYFPLGPFPGLLARLRETDSISRVFKEDYDCDHIRRSTIVTARQVRPEHARLLSLPLNQPILLVEAINVDQHGRVIEYGITCFRGDRTELVFDAPAPR